MATKTANLAQLSNTFDVNSSGAVSVGGSTGTSGQVLTSQGSGAAPQWTAVPSAFDTALALLGNTRNQFYSASSTFTVPSSVTSILSLIHI